MQNDNYIPEASEPDTYVDGRLVPVALARSVRWGWKAGVAYLVLTLITTAILLYAEAVPMSAVAIGIADIVVIGVLVYGVHKWNLWAAVILFLHPLAMTLLAALSNGTGEASYGQQGGGLRIIFLIVFGVLFGRAMLAIRAFRAKSG